MHTHTVANTRALRHADKSLLVRAPFPHKHAHASSLCIYQFINCAERHTRDGQLKMHGELKTQASTGVQQGNSERERKVGYKVVSERSFTSSDTYSISWTHPITHTETHTQTHCARILLSLSYILFPSSSQECVYGRTWKNCFWEFSVSMHVLWVFLCRLTRVCCHNDSCGYC